MIETSPPRGAHMSAPAEQLPRSAWTDTEPGFPNWPERKINPNDVWGNVLHYPAAGNRSFAGLSKKEIARWLNIWRDYHVNTRGCAQRHEDLRQRQPAAHGHPAHPRRQRGA